MLTKPFNLILCRRRPNVLIRTIAFFVFIALSISAKAQFRVAQWANFEDGKIPAGALKFGLDVSQKLAIQDLDKLPDLKSPKVLYGAGGWELGHGGLALLGTQGSALAHEYIYGIGFGEAHDRSGLGSVGRALYQADFFIPEDKEQLPSMAVVAMEPLDPNQETTASLPLTFYRFGITLGNRVFFSCVYKYEAPAKVFLQDTEFLNRIPKPAWHRFAIMFEGTDTIRCFVDGFEPAFSPIKESTIQKMKIGIMMAENKRDYTAYVDNVSIQLADDSAKLPKSPYAPSWPLAPPSSGREVARPVAAKSPASDMIPLSDVMGPEVKWVEPRQAWESARQSGKSMILYFESPQTEGSQRLDEILVKESAARNFMSNYHCARIDINQLMGGTQAREYGVYKVPAFLIIAPDNSPNGAHEAGRATFGIDDDWQKFAAKLGAR